MIHLVDFAITILHHRHSEENGAELFQARLRKPVFMVLDCVQLLIPYCLKCITAQCLT